MQEIEVKILEIHREKIEKALVDLGAKKVFDGDIETVFFDFENGAIIKQKNVLRLRKAQEKVELTFKKVHATQIAKAADEYSVEVSNMETMKEILGNLGLSIVDKTQKHRISYTLDSARFDFDCYIGDFGFIPEFLEIEAKSPELIYKFAKLLGFEPKDCLPWSTSDLISHYAFKKTIT